MQLFNNKNKVKKSKDYPKNPIVKKTFIKSLYDYPDGVDIEIKNISKLMPDRYKDDKYSMYINIKIIGQMPKCDAFVVDENNEYVTIPDRHGVMQHKIQQINAHDHMVSIHVTLEKAPLSNEFLVNTYKSYYDLFRFALYKAGHIPANYDNDFTISYDELNEILVNLKCCLQVGKSAMKGMNPYDVFYASDVSIDCDADFVDAHSEISNGDI